MSSPVEEFLGSQEPEATMRAHVDAAVAERRRRFEGGEDGRWRPGGRLELLLVGYSGAGNAGADVRVIELVRQLRAILGADAVGLTLTTVAGHLPRAALPGVREAFVDDYMPTFLADRCGAAHGVLACEGSMFKSTFSNALATLMIGALGMASAEGKPSVGYGAEAGAMDEELQAFARRHAAGALVICRNERSRRQLDALGLRTALGADPAWTFEPAPPLRAQELLRAAGWDGRPYLAVCPINPFWWPVRADLRRAQELQASGAHLEQHYVSVFFHHHSDETSEAYERYLDGLAAAIATHCAERGLAPVVLGMERLDRRACEDLATRLAVRPPVLVSGGLEPGELVAVLRGARVLVSSRYHALVTSLPGLVPGVGVSMDERIDTLLDELGRPDLCLRADEPELGEALLGRLRAVEDGALADAQGRLVADQVRRLGLGGIAFADELARVYPEYPLPDLPRSWEAHVPPPPAAVTALLERFG